MRVSLIILLVCYRLGGVAAVGPKSDDAHMAEELNNRKYRLDMKGFWPEFEKLTHAEEQIRAKMQPPKSTGIWSSSFNSTTVVQEAFAKLLKDEEGVSLQSPAAFFLNDRLGIVLVRGTAHQCERVKHLLGKLNGRPMESGGSQ